MKRAALLLAISDYSKSEAVAALDLPPDRIAVIGGAADPRFRIDRSAPELRRGSRVATSTYGR